MRAAEDGCGLYLANHALSKRLASSGIRPVLTKRELSSADESSRLFQVIDASGMDVVRTRSPTTDFCVWGWIPVVSDAFKDLAIATGCQTDEFVPCRIEFHDDARFFMHLPEARFDIVDLALTEFGTVLPLDPPLPLDIRTLVTKNHGEDLPGCFRAKHPWPDQSFAELFVTDRFRDQWIERRLSGAILERMR